MSVNPETPCDHVWTYVADWMGDPGIPNGTVECGYYECLECGLEQAEKPEGYEPIIDREWDE